jgi:hypothetical protein
MQKRIERFNKFGRKFFIIIIEFNQSTNNKKRKREKDSIIIIFTILTGNIIIRFESDNINRLDWFLNLGATGHFFNNKV